MSGNRQIAHVRVNADGDWADIGIASTTAKLASCGGKQVYNEAEQNEAKRMNSFSPRHADSHFLNRPEAKRERLFPEGFPSAPSLPKGQGGRYE